MIFFDNNYCYITIIYLGILEGKEILKNINIKTFLKNHDFHIRTVKKKIYIFKIFLK